MSLTGLTRPEETTTLVHTSNDEVYLCISDKDDRQPFYGGATEETTRKRAVTRLGICKPRAALHQ